MLKLDDVWCGYNDTFTMRGITMSVGEREIVGIIGPNGSGKTTLLRAVTKVLALHRGSVILDGIDLATMTFRQLALRAAMVSQDVYIPAGITVEEFVALGRIPHQKRLQFFGTRRDNEAVRHALDIAGVASFAQRSVASLSGGERQLVMIAKALAQEPKLLLLDEPVVYLDITHQTAILDLMRRLRKQKGIAVVVTLHELNLAAEYCDRLVLLEQGRVHAIGQPAEILTVPVIEQVYRTRVLIERHPLSGKPYVIVVPEEG